MASLHKQRGDEVAPNPSQDHAQPLCQEPAQDGVQGAREEPMVPTRRCAGLPIMMILCIEMCERNTYYTLQSTLRNFLLDHGYELAASSSINSSFNTLGWLCCFPGGWAADTVGLYTAIVLACVLYVSGISLVAVAAVPQISSVALFLAGAMVLVTLGMGGIKPNIMNFGANQITTPGEAGKRQKCSFFAYFYLMINVGCFPAFGYFSTLATSGQPPAIPKEYGYLAAYGVAAGCMAFAALLFLIGTPFYVRGASAAPTSRAEGALPTIVRTLWAKATDGSSGSRRAQVAIFGWLLMPIFLLLAILSSMLTKSLDATTISVLSYSSLGLGLLSVVVVSCAHLDNSFLDSSLPGGGEEAQEEGAEDASGRFTVQDVKATFKTIPMILLVNIAFNLCYNAMNGAMPAQACQMNCFIHGDTQINGAFFNLGDALAIVLLVPVFDSCIYPLWAMLQGRPVSLGQKLIAGLLCAAISNAVSILLDQLRKAAPLMTDRPFSDCAPEGTYMNDISAFWMFIPFALVGIGEILVMPSMYHFAFEAAPEKVRSTLQAFNLLAQGALSNAFTGGIQLAFMPNDLNKGKPLALYYAANILSAFAGIVLYSLMRRVVGSSRNFLNHPILDEDNHEHPSIRAGINSHSFVDDANLRN